MRIALCQIDTTVGDLESNRSLVRQACAEAAAAGARLALFPELTLTGYPPRDLLDRPGFVRDTRLELDLLAAELPAGLAALVGFVEPTESGKAAAPLHNAMALLEAGRCRQTFHKRLLPFYDVFDERRHFEPGEAPQCFELDGVRFGVLICEDAWNEVEGPLRTRYPHNPVQACIDAGAQVLLNPAASPFTLAKLRLRSAMFASIARQRGVPLAMCNLVGGNDDLLFDGASALYAADGRVVARAPRFQSAVCVADLAASGGQEPTAPSEASAALDALVMGVRDYAKKCGFSRGVLGLSGGVDSALTACIAAEALGAANVLGVAMPTRYSSQHSLDDAQALAEALGIGHRVIPIDGVFQGFLDQLGPVLGELGPAPEKDTTFENIQARIRGVTLMSISNRLGHLLLTTGNKSEIAVGYCTLYGDMAGGLAVISDLPKTFVYDVAREVNRRAGRDLIPESTLTKPPSAELRPDQTDQDSLPPYAVLDAILERLVEDQHSVAEIIAAGFEAATVEQVARMVRGNEYKRRQMPPGLILTRKAFGPGRRYPIAQRYRR
jgi:NAD+ synthase (glutamine-hydrolysing)